MLNLLTEGFNTICGWIVDVAEWPGMVPVLAVGAVLATTAFVVKVSR